MVEPLWITHRLAIAIHRRQLAEHGGPDGLRDDSLLESALARPKNVYHYEDPTPGIPRLAAAYAWGIVRNHPFVDGNKRTGYVVAETFLRLNGYAVTAPGTIRYELVIAIANGKLTEQETRIWFLEYSTRSS